MDLKETKAVVDWISLAQGKFPPEHKVSED